MQIAESNHSCAATDRRKHKRGNGRDKVEDDDDMMLQRCPSTCDVIVVVIVDVVVAASVPLAYFLSFAIVDHELYDG